MTYTSTLKTKNNNSNKNKYQSEKSIKQKTDKENQ